MKFKVGDLVKIPVFYKGFTITITGMIASELKEKLRPSDGKLGTGYEVLSEKNEMLWVWSHNVEVED